ncbi:MAG: FRG domain-containing protein [Planctomycetota bacterium]
MIDLVEKDLTRASAYIYRGQADWNWPIVSSLHRWQQKYPRRKNLASNDPEYFDSPPFSEDEHLAAFQRAIRGRIGPNESPQNEDEWWALGQHHGLATPLIDWTRSPFMALFFAFDEERAVQDRDRFVPPSDRAVFALSTSVWPEGEGGHEAELRFVSPATGDISRLVSQQGLLLRLPPDTDLESYVRRKFRDETREEKRQPILTKVRIPNKDRDACLVMLDKMGINHMTLFPDISGAARHVNSLWQPGHENSIPYV